MATTHKTKLMHFTVHCKSSVMICSGIRIADEASMIDTDETHFSFGIYNIDALEFADALQRLLDNRLDIDKYRDYDYIELKASSNYDTIRMTRDCTSLGITRGNLKVLYFASTDSLHGLPEAICKEYKRYEAKVEKDAEEWSTTDYPKNTKIRIN
jgi:hypothetical protein